ncbi:armadillo beta-catenin plakoglobin [Ceraceosorus bombacis]|uniref:Armadillo beta-catenin plakoglobin n=1 Tax=Ceraceosorus bombacis TaxID=401625 RepID=A0A0N7LB94_9BASI|nr:armadillo beta-catenin plakoglobin [Ceraceosorus bombacis]
MTPATPRREVRQSPFEMSPLPMARTGSSALAIPEDQLPPNVDLLAQTPQLQALLTTMHDKTVRGEDFIFTIDRVAALVLERATVHLPHREKKITLFSGKEHIGCEVAAENICSVSILRSGAILEPSARRAIPALQAGSLLIQSDKEGEPKLYTVDLPRFLRSPTNAQSAWVLLLDSQLGTGAAALMGVRVLLDHNVKEEHIIFVTLLASARGGVHALHRAFPRVKIVVGGVDPDLKRRVVPAPLIVPEAHAVDPKAVRGRSPATSRLLRARSVAPRSAAFSSSTDSAWSADDEALTDAVHSTRVCWSIEPGCGNMGDRYYGVDSSRQDDLHPF